MPTPIHTALSPGLLLQERLLDTARLPGFGHHADKFYRCEVIFGMPSADCAGTGICKIVINRQSLAPRHRGNDCKSTSALFACDGDSGEFSLFLFRDLLCVELYRRHLRGGVLELREPCRLPADLLAHFRLPMRTIGPGAYPIEVRPGCFQIRFNPSTGA